MTESVEQAALRRAHIDAWKGRAEREAAALLDESGVTLFQRNTVIALLAASWLQGFNLGAHDTLSAADAAFENARAAL